MACALPFQIQKEIIFSEILSQLDGQVSNACVPVSDFNIFSNVEKTALGILSPLLLILLVHFNPPVFIVNL